MEPSQFLALAQKWFAATQLNRVELLNGSQNGLTYLFQRFLAENQSVTGRWETLLATYTRVMAFVVAMDSSLPKVKRDSTSNASGDIPKFGIEMSLNERQLTQIGILQRAPGDNTKAIIKKIFNDAERTVDAAYELMEALFLEGFSTGKVIVDDIDNVGTGFQVDFGYLSANKFGVGILWSSASTAKPMDDLDRMVAKAKTDGKVIQTIFMDSTTFGNMIATTQFRDYYAFKVGYTGTLRTNLDKENANALLLGRYGFTVELIDRAVRRERNGVQTIVKPYQQGMVMAICTEELGAIEYTFLAEEDSPVSGVVYSKPVPWALGSMFRQNRPSIAEFTTIQGRALPVIGAADEIYSIDTTTVQS
ncbi:hypothetical protein GO755_34925 [Spirosoma sp. HMF4905]|uniref:Major capsid protein n=1 Tax=Spirosoma arboris TaxID=2682092 RepID=A0A7K1SN90_9BACT|nr:major capsid protein [Spirosoma arboris]MVM35268.1 hypothetical protein [Spirosoma arboris]